MKKAIIITTLSLLVLAIPAYAAQNGHGNANNANNSQGENHGNSNGNNNNQGNKNAEINDPTPTLGLPIVEPTSSITPTVTQDATTTPTLTPTVTTPPACDPNAHWKNHGAYVSCVAHLHEGGSSVSDAAKSDVGKKHNDENVTPTPSVSITPSISPSPITSALPTIGGGITPFSALGDLFGKFFNFFKHLLK